MKTYPTTEERRIKADQKAKENQPKVELRRKMEQLRRTEWRTRYASAEGVTFITTNNTCPV